MKLKWSSFCCAFSGVLHLLKTQAHARWHLLVSLLVIVLGLGLSVSRVEWLVLLLTMALVWTAEALNTALELACNAITREPNPLIGQAKDMAAGAVLLAAGFAVVIGGVVFLPRLWKMIES
jgi:diacylglycerol kinase